MKSPLDAFFKLGDKATRGDPLKKAQFDYYLYWIVFLAFVSMAISYYYSFFFKGAGFYILMWAIIITVFCWFNYYGLLAFRSMYLAQLKLRNSSITSKPLDEETVKEMLDAFKEEPK